MRPNCTSHPLLSILAALAFVGVCSLVLTTAGCSGDDDSGGGAAISDAGGAAADGAGNISDGASSQDASTEDGGSGAGGMALPVPPHTRNRRHGPTSRSCPPNWLLELGGLSIPVSMSLEAL